MNAYKFYLISKLETLADIMDGPIITNGLNLLCVITVTFQVHYVIIYTNAANTSNLTLKIPRTLFSCFPDDKIR